MFTYLDSLSNDRIYTGVQRGWYYVNYFFHRYFGYDFFMLFCYGVIYCGIASFIQKYSKNSAISIWLWFTLYFFFSSMNIMRQYVAIGMVLLVIGKAVTQPKQFICWVLLAATIHYSALICLSFLLFRYIRMNQKVIVLSAIASSFVVGLTMTYLVSDFLQNVMGYIGALGGGIGESAESYIGGYSDGRNILTNAGVNIVVIATYLFSKDKNNQFLKMFVAYIVLNNLFGGLGQGNRMFLYFYIPAIVAIPNAYTEIRGPLAKMTYFILFVGFSVAVWIRSLDANFSDVVPYAFR